jgi:hypothetical protein
MKTGTNKLLCLIGLKVQGDLGQITCYTSKRNRVVWYLNAPPMKPPTYLQIEQMNKFRNASLSWLALSGESRVRWSTAASAAHLRITGFNLWTYWQLKGDVAAIRTIEHQTGIFLLA